VTLNKKCQYALLLVFYLKRSGKANLEDVAANLNISLTFLQQVARHLRIAKVITSAKGPHGGSEVIGDPTLLSVLKAAGLPLAMSNEDLDYLNASQCEELRTLGLFGTQMNYLLNNFLKLKCSTFGKALVEREVALITKLVEKELAC
jgi:DNA-binding IscR family transcriptional regulator